MLMQRRHATCAYIRVPPHPDRDRFCSLYSFNHDAHTISPVDRSSPRLVHAKRRDRQPLKSNATTQNEYTKMTRSSSGAWLIFILLTVAMVDPLTMLYRTVYNRGL